MLLDVAHEGCVRRRTVVAGIAQRSASGVYLGMERESGSAEGRIWKFCVLRALDRVIAVASVNSIVER